MTPLLNFTGYDLPWGVKFTPAPVKLHRGSPAYNSRLPFKRRALLRQLLAFDRHNRSSR